MNKYLVSIYTGSANTLQHLMGTDIRPVQAHLDEALVIVLKDTEMAKSERMQNAEMLLCAGANPNKYTSAHDPILVWATQKNDMELVQLLLNFGANVNCTDPDRATCLHHCAGLGLSEVAGVLLAAGADPNIQDREGRIPLVSALLGDDWGMVELLLIDSDVNTANHDGETPLYTMLLYSGCPLANRALPRLIEAGADLDVRTASGDRDTALFPVAKMAALAGVDMDLLEMLLSAGCQVNIQDNHGYTALHDVAASCPDPGTTETLLFPREVARALIRAGANVNLQDFSGRTPFVQAVVNQNVYVAEELLQANCDIRLTGVRPRSFMEFVRCAADLGRMNSINYLLKEPVWIQQPRILEKLFSTLSLELNGDCAEVDDQQRRVLERQPVSLSELCRYPIRSRLPPGCQFHGALDSLPLPTKIKDFIALRTRSDC